MIPTISPVSIAAGAQPNHESIPIPKKSPPRIGTKILQVVSSAVTTKSSGAESGAERDFLVVWLVFLGSRGDVDILVQYSNAHKFLLGTS